jgi:hypothetical protein
MKGSMLCRLLINVTKFILLALVIQGVSVVSLPRTCTAQQLQPASPPVANPNDHRFEGVKEDWTTPSLKGSDLRPMRPLLGSTDEEKAYTLELLCLQWRWGDPIDVYLIKPNGVKKPPVIIYQYGYPYDTDSFRDERWDNAVTKDGFAAVAFVTALTGHRYHDRPMKEWFVSELQESLATSAHDVQLVLDYLGHRGDLDMNRVGLFTQGSGATIGILTSAVDPRIKVLDAIDTWGDWPTWMATSPFVPEEERSAYVKPDFLKKVALLEPIDWLPKVQAKKFRFQQTDWDEDTPAACRKKLRDAVPASATVTLYKTEGQYSAAMFGNQQLDWIKNALRSLPEPEPDKTAAEQKTSLSSLH